VALAKELMTLDQMPYSKTKELVPLSTIILVSPVVAVVPETLRASTVMV